ncbi:SelT/SelW/SelH selenoprotein [Thermobaculum terrenum ATCC BAA-798]|uniref:SelT/SelW/SelH selenoprotein n=1 Tax=Thermobaculum terrenum (strain ATCC BAA-798 / CCMEE 7001 / YNP1) TaxID=525904 RepID=D1CH66_THET1|nr:SelT/SelW/SelH selenoprotein [Thermobaculum terrenum ATCC BAA-798]
MLHDFHPGIKELVLVPSSGGVFEVSLGDELLFSKRQEGRFPEPEEILRVLETRGVKKVPPKQE